MCNKQSTQTCNLQIKASNLTADCTRGDTINMLLFCRWREPSVIFNASSKWLFDGHHLFSEPSLNVTQTLVLGQ